jgi:hypothetical protein
VGIIFEILMKGPRTSLSYNIFQRRACDPLE